MNKEEKNGPKSRLSVAVKKATQGWVVLKGVKPLMESVASTDYTSAGDMFNIATNPVKTENPFTHQREFDAKKIANPANILTAGVNTVEMAVRVGVDTLVEGFNNSNMMQGIKAKREGAIEREYEEQLKNVKELAKHDHPGEFIDLTRVTADFEQ